MLEPAPRLQRDACEQGAPGVGRQQQAVGHAGIAVPEISRVLGASYVVEGTVRRNVNDDSRNN